MATPSGSSISEYFSCSTCSSYHTCPDCLHLHHLLDDHDRPPSGDGQVLEEVLSAARPRRSLLKKSHSAEDARDIAAEVAAQVTAEALQQKHLQRQEDLLQQQKKQDGDAVCHTRGRRDISSQSPSSSSRSTSGRRGRPSIHPDAAGRWRSRSRSLTKEVVQSFLHFHETVLRRSRSGSRSRKSSSESLTRQLAEEQRAEDERWLQLQRAAEDYLLGERSTRADEHPSTFSMKANDANLERSSLDTSNPFETAPEASSLQRGYERGAYEPMDDKDAYSNSELLGARYHEGTMVPVPVADYQEEQLLHGKRYDVLKDQDPIGTSFSGEDAMEATRYDSHIPDQWDGPEELPKNGKLGVSTDEDPDKWHKEYLRRAEKQHLENLSREREEELRASRSEEQQWPEALTEAEATSGMADQATGGLMADFERTEDSSMSGLPAPVIGPPAPAGACTILLHADDDAIPALQLSIWPPASWVSFPYPVGSCASAPHIPHLTLLEAQSLCSSPPACITSHSSTSPTSSPIRPHVSPIASTNVTGGSALTRSKSSPSLTEYFERGDHSCPAIRRPLSKLNLSSFYRDIPPRPRTDLRLHQTSGEELVILPPLEPEKGLMDDLRQPSQDNGNAEGENKPGDKIIQQSQNEVDAGIKPLPEKEYTIDFSRELEDESVESEFVRYEDLAPSERPESPKYFYHSFAEIQGSLNPYCIDDYGYDNNVDFARVDEIIAEEDETNATDNTYENVPYTVQSPTSDSYVSMDTEVLYSRLTPPRPAPPREDMDTTPPPRPALPTVLVDTRPKRRFSLPTIPEDEVMILTSSSFLPESVTLGSSSLRRDETPPLTPPTLRAEDADREEHSFDTRDELQEDDDDVEEIEETLLESDSEIDDVAAEAPVESSPSPSPTPPPPVAPPRQRSRKASPESVQEENLAWKMRKSSEWLELRIVELAPGLVHLGSNLQEAQAMQRAHLEVLTKLQSKQSPVEDLLNQADQLISTQRPRAEVYAAMAESLGLAWKELNQQLETRKNLLDLAVIFQTRASRYSSALDAAEKTYTDNLLPTEVETCRELISALHDHKRAVLEASMHTLQEGQVLLARLRGLLHEGATMDSRPQHIRISIDFACSQVEHQLEALHDRRRFLDGLFAARRLHLDQSLALALLYQDLTQTVVSLRTLRDEVSHNQDLGASQTQAEVLQLEHQPRDGRARARAYGERDVLFFRLAHTVSGACSSSGSRIR
ncbi:uncharacterized protein LOC108682035 [Hyalella azteca]|uniref:Uncharacterized protein LOC108682035 n=1 Tax=Hyalella azteca TaxID=294128 RepID=A0A979FJS3_HYAAZ|nr:uncharacterized protein LOC108682035 [Hyalella azteca]